MLARIFAVTMAATGIAVPLQTAAAGSTVVRRCDYRPVQCIRAPCPQYICTSKLRGNEKTDPDCELVRNAGGETYYCGRPPRPQAPGAGR